MTVAEVRLSHLPVSRDASAFLSSVSFLGLIENKASIKNNLHLIVFGRGFRGLFVRVLVEAIH
jgi:hypothetical protein